jgi:hypothetical protein
MRIADDIHVRAWMNVKADVAPIAPQPRIDLRTTGTELKDAVGVPGIRSCDEIREDRVIRIVATVSPERTRGQADESDQGGSSLSLKRLLERPVHRNEF